MHSEKGKVMVWLKVAGIQLFEGDLSKKRLSEMVDSDTISEVQRTLK